MTESKILLASVQRLRATILDKLTANQQAMCRVCLIRLDKTYANLEITGEFGQWITANGSNEIHVNIPLNVFYNMEEEHPLDGMQPQRSNVAMSICEELKFQIEEIIKANPEAARCTDINRPPLMVEEMEITYLPLNSDGKVNRSAVPLILDRNSDLTQIFKEHVIYTTSVQLLQPSTEPISFNKQFVYNFQVDTSHIVMPSRWTSGIVDADEISSPRLPGLKEKIRMSIPPKKVSFSSSDEVMKGILESQVLLAKHLDPATFGQAIATAVSSVLTTTIGAGTIESEVSNGISQAMKDVLIPALQASIPTTTTKTPKVPGTMIVTTRGAPSNPLTIKLAPNESISDFITELPRTSGKIPRLSTWNEHILPACVKRRYDAAHDLTAFLTSDIIDTAYIYDVDDGTSGPTLASPTAPVVPVSYT